MNVTTKTIVTEIYHWQIHENLCFYTDINKLSDLY